MKKIMLIPLDERPCNYNFANVMTENNQDIELLMPPLNILGHKKTPASFELLKTFILNNIQDCYGLILSIDMLLYGGIVPSRLHYYQQNFLIERLNLIKEIKQLNPKIIIYAFALIMRCPQYSSSDEEPDYYEECGYNIFKYGELLHKIELNVAGDEEKNSLDYHKHKCQPYWQDYLARRTINSDLNIAVVKLLKEKYLDFLVIPQDDSSLYGLIVKDQQKIFQEIAKYNLEDDVLIYPGADEVGMVLMARMINHINQKTPKIYVGYATMHGHLFVPMFEDREVYKTVSKQLTSSGSILCESWEDADGILMLNTPTLDMKDPNITEGYTDAIKNDKRNIKAFVNQIEQYIKAGKKVAIADVSIVNMGDLELIEAIKEKNIYFQLAGYSGWNTSSNTLGTALTHLIINIHYGNTPALKKHLALRIYEDIGYCAHTRKYMCDNILPQMNLGYFNSGTIEGEVSQLVQQEITKYVKKVLPTVFDNYEISRCYMPWCRMFEVALQIKKR